MRLVSAQQFLDVVRRLLAAQMDVNIELRGPKGWGKSSFAFAIQRLLVPGFEDFNALVYSHVDYARRYRDIRARRLAGDRAPQFIWVDDAARIFDRRGHMTRKNRAMLTINRTMRSQLGAVQFLLTQDDLLEEPLREGGNYFLFILDRPYHAFYYHLQVDPHYRGTPRLERRFPCTWADPVAAYPEVWRRYQQVRERMTDELTDELLEEIESQPDTGTSQARRKVFEPEDWPKVQAMLASGMTHQAIANAWTPRVGQSTVTLFIKQSRQRDKRASPANQQGPGTPGATASIAGADSTPQPS